MLSRIYVILNDSYAELDTRQSFSFVTTTTRHSKKASVTRKNYEKCKVTVYKWSSHNEYRHNAIPEFTLLFGLKTLSRCRMPSSDHVVCSWLIGLPGCPEDCHIRNQSLTWLDLHCRPGWSGGLGRRAGSTKQGGGGDERPQGGGGFFS